MTATIGHPVTCPSCGREASVAVGWDDRDGTLDVVSYECPTGCRVADHAVLAATAGQLVNARRPMLAG